MANLIGDTIDSLLPSEMAVKAEGVGVKKVKTEAVALFALAVLAGAFIALGAIFSTTVTTNLSAIRLTPR